MAIWTTLGPYEEKRNKEHTSKAGSPSNCIVSEQEAIVIVTIFPWFLESRFVEARQGSHAQEKQMGKKKRTVKL